jgi:hypothetical protein
MLDNLRGILIKNLYRQLDSERDGKDISNIENNLKRLLLVNLKIEIQRAKDFIINNQRGASSHNELFSNTKEVLVRYIDFIKQNSKELDPNYKNLIEDFIKNRDKIDVLNSSSNFYKAIKILLANHYELHTELASLEAYKSLNDLDFNRLEKWLLEYTICTRNLPGFTYGVDTIKLLMAIFKTVYEEQDNKNLCFLDIKGRITTYGLKLPTWIQNFREYCEALESVNKDLFESLKLSANFYFDFETYTINPKISQ